MMNLKWKIVALTGLIAVICSVYIWGIPAIVNLPERKSIFEQKILEQSGFRVDLGNPNLSMGSFPSVWIYSDNISVLNKNGSKALSVDNPRIKIKLFPLIFKKVEIANVIASREDINLVLTQDKKFYLGDYLLKLPKGEKKFTFEKANLNIGPYNIKLDDKLNNITASLRGEYIQDSQYIRDKKVKLSTVGDIIIGDESTNYFADVDLLLPIRHLTGNKLKLNAKIDNFDLSYISDYVSILTNNKIKELGGIFSFNATTKYKKSSSEEIDVSIETTGLKVIGEDEPSSIIFEDNLAVNINFETINKGVKFKNSSVKAKDIGLLVNGTLTQSGKKVPAMDLIGKFSPTRLERLCKIIPGLHNLLPDMDLYYLKENFFYGSGDGEIHFIGHGERPEVYGEARLRDTYIVKRIPNTPKGADVDMKFKGKVMHLDVFVPTGPKSNVTVNGDIKIDGSKYSELKIKNEGDVIMEYAQPVVIPLQKIFKFKMGPVPIMKITGLGNIDVYSAGKKIDPHLWGTFTFKNATASFNQIKYLELKNASGKIDFNDTDIPFKITSGTINGKTANISGKCNVMGDVNVDASTKGQNIPDIIRIINSSEDMYDVQRVIKPFTKPNGIADISLNIYGNAKDATRVKFNEDLFAKGTITFHDATTLLKDTYLPLQKINGVVNFDKKDADYDVTGFINKSKISVKGTAHDKNMDLVATTDKIPVADIIDMFQPNNTLPFKKEIGLLDVSFKGSYKGLADSDNLDYDKIVVDGNIIANMNTNNPIKVNGGSFNIRHGILTSNNLKGLFNNNPFTLSFSGTNIYKKMKIKDAKFNFNNFNIASLETIKSQLTIPQNLKKQVDNLTDFSGIIDINGHIDDGKIYSDTNLNNISFKYKPTDSLIKINSGKANIKNNTLYLGQINTLVSSMPVFLNGSVSDITSTPNANIYLSGKLNQSFVDKFFNANSVYPIKIKGDVNFNSVIKGTLDKIHSISTLKIKENSSIYYMGATLEGAPSGDSEGEGLGTNPVAIIADLMLYPNKVYLNSLKYEQTISSQNKKQSVQNLLTAFGEIDLLQNNVLGFRNLKIKTFEPTSAKIFNILLKKPTIKQGNFTTDLLVNGTSLKPKVLGNLNLYGIDVPLFDSTIRDINVDFKNDYVYLNSKGAVLTNDITLYAKAVNNSSLPYIIEDLQIKTDALNLNDIAEKFNDFDTENLKKKQIASEGTVIAPEQIILKNAEILADKIIIKKAEATDFKSKMNINNNVLNVENFSFNLANGVVDGNIKTNLSTMDSSAHMSIKNADAQIISENFFDMPGQVYGNVTGDMDIYCTGLSGVECVKTLSGQGHFDVTDGRMPKLGSLEYLLKAANLVTGGITGVSINGIVDLVTPLKTGYFESIKGDIKVENGIANDIQVYSRGKDLSMYMTGSYNLTNLVADMDIYGSLSKDFSTVLGRIGNLSLNRLFSTIPGISINEVTSDTTSNIYKIPGFDKNSVLRVFKAEIYGDINGSNYVKSFKWIKH